ncbi:hypothetical protein PG991_014347 [Apiospora marii]|uniref:Uncharacterized protein n=1 Tax=Apiospora marii TaxID=335849 RepID=A0ABR1R8J4_9PEZI
MRLTYELGLLSLATGAVGLSATSGFVSVDGLFDREPGDAKLVHDTLETGSAERTVAFKPFERYWQFLAEDSVLRDSEWKWLVKTGQGPITDPSQPSGVDDNNPYIVSTAYHLSWPNNNNDRNISDALDGANGTICTSALESADVPVRVLNNFATTDTDGNNDNSGDCVPVPGQECVDALLSPQGGAVTVENDVCRGPAHPWHDLPACRDSLGRDKASGTQWAGTPLSGRNPLNNATRPQPWRSGDDFYVNVSSPVSGGGGRDSDEYLTRVNQLHVLMLDARVPSSREGQLVGGPQVLCLRVNTTRLPENDRDGDGVAMLSESLRRGEQQWCCWSGLRRHLPGARRRCDSD